MLFRLFLNILCIILLAGFIGCEPQNETVKSFAGHYIGTYSGEASGTWTAEFSADGMVEATIQDSSMGEIYGRGTIDPTGEMSLSTKGHVADRMSFATWKGAFKIEDGVCTGSGTWSAGEGIEGKWEGKRE